MNCRETSNALPEIKHAIDGIQKLWLWRMLLLLLLLLLLFLLLVLVMVLVVLLLLQASTGRYRHRTRRSSLGFNKSPHVPRSNGPVRPPLVTQLVHLRGPGSVLEVVEKLNSFPDAKVIDGENIGSVE